MYNGEGYPEEWPMKQNKASFTLIEFMIVAVIVAILASIAAPMYMRYMERAHNLAAQALLKQLVLAEEAYNVDNQAYVTDLAATGEGGEAGGLAALALNGFRPDPNVAFYVAPPKGGEGYVAFAIYNRPGAALYGYDSASSTGPQKVAGVLPPKKEEKKGDKKGDQKAPALAAGAVAFKFGELKLFKWENDAAVDCGGELGITSVGDTGLAAGQ